MINQESKQDRLEKLLTLGNGFKRSAERSFYKYSVDVLSGWSYYTPVYMAQEILLAGKDLETSIKTRALGLVVHASAMRPIGILRNYVAKKWNVTNESSALDKMKVNLVAVTPVQSVAYAGMLVGGMTWSGNYDWKSSAIAWSIGIGVGAFHSIPYGWVQDRIRENLGVPPAIKKIDV